MYFPHKHPVTVHRQFEGRAAQDIKAVALRKRRAEERQEQRLNRRRRLIPAAAEKRARKGAKRLSDWQTLGNRLSTLPLSWQAGFRTRRRWRFSR